MSDFPKYDPGDRWTLLPDALPESSLFKRNRAAMKEATFTFEGTFVSPSEPALDITLESLAEAVERAKSLPRPEFDVLVCTRGVYEQVKAHCQPADPLLGASPPLYGIPILLADDPVAARHMAVEQVMTGRRVMLAVDGAEAWEVLSMEPPEANP